MSLSIQEIETEILTLPEQEQLKLIDFVESLLALHYFLLIINANENWLFCTKCVYPFDILKTTVKFPCNL